MNNIQIIKTDINVSKILKQLKNNPEGWNTQMNMTNAKSLLDQGFPEVDVGVLQLTIGGVHNVNDYVGNTEICINTPLYTVHTETVRFLKRNGFKNHSRCGFLSLPVGCVVGKHIDIGTYYHTRDRYHLSIQGVYKYSVGDESAIVNPGTLFKFDNSIEHGTENIGNDVRITFVFDVPRKGKEKIWR
jgi:hypothetical protein